MDMKEAHAVHCILVSAKKPGSLGISFPRTPSAYRQLCARAPRTLSSVLRPRSVWPAAVPRCVPCYALLDVPSLGSPLTRWAPHSRARYSSITALRCTEHMGSARVTEGSPMSERDF